MSNRKPSEKNKMSNIRTHTNEKATIIWSKDKTKIKGLICAKCDKTINKSEAVFSVKGTQRRLIQLLCPNCQYPLKTICK